MEFLSQHYLPGAITLWSAVLFALASVWGYLQVYEGDESARPFARRAYGFYVFAVMLAALVLFLALARRDFRIEYVFQYSALDLPFRYQVAAFWAGQKGSFLIWLLWAVLLGLPLIRTAGKKDEAPVMGIYTLTTMGLLFILVRENPFIMLGEAPLDGKGLNPLLQDDWMVIHPPVMFIGYALAAVPFAFALSAMWRRDTSRWATKAFPWALAGFLVLGTAILMGGYWAYKTLGWGGYWGWDPVENASLIPWLIGVVLIHGLHLERTRQRYRRANLLLSCLLFMAVLYGTFLTRSGVLADFSVHSFVDLGISRWLVAWMAVWGLLSLWMLSTRMPKVATERNEDALLSRGAFMVLSTIVVSLSAIVVTIGTSAPILTFFLKDPGQVGPSFYNTTNFPLAILIALLLSMVPYLTWKGEKAEVLFRRLLPAAGIALLVTAGAVVAAVREPMHVVFVYLAVLAVVTNLHKTLLLGRAGGLKAAGGYLAHVGVGIILLGIISSSAYDESSKVTLIQNEPQMVGDLTLTFERFVPRGELPEECGRKECMQVKVVTEDGSSFYSYPKLFINDRTRQLMANPHIRKTLLRDLYVSPIEYDPGQPGGAFRQVQLAKGQTATIGDVEVRFVDFDLNAAGNAHAQLASGTPVTVGARIEILRRGGSEVVTPLYRFGPGQQVVTPPASIPGGGTVTLANINPNDGAVVLALSGIGDSEREPAKLALDVSKKPLIKLVWWGLFVVLAGGLISTAYRLRQARDLNRREDQPPPEPAG